MTTLSAMQRALTLAAQGRMSVSPNPMVGCVIVKQGSVIGEGYHQRAGEAHAEIMALQMAGVAAQGATAYVTLEPCCHRGRTPACTEALINAGIFTVHVACRDPNPRVAGKGIAALQAAGIEVIEGECAAEAQALNKKFFHYITHKRPYVIAKWAMSLDGKTVTHPQDSREISGAAMRAFNHDLRCTVDAILVGARTVRADNPQLTARDEQGVVAGRQPLRIILSSGKELPVDATLFHADASAKTLVVVPMTRVEAVQKFLPPTVEVLGLPEVSVGQVSVENLLTVLGQREITSLLVEGGMQVHQAFFAAGLVNEVRVSISPVFVGDLPHKLRLKEAQGEWQGEDFYFKGNS